MSQRVPIPVRHFFGPNTFGVTWWNGLPNLCEDHTRLVRMLHLLRQPLELIRVLNLATAAGSALRHDLAQSGGRLLPPPLQEPVQLLVGCDQLLLLVSDLPLLLHLVEVDLGPVPGAALRRPRTIAPEGIRPSFRRVPFGFARVDRGDDDPRFSLPIFAVRIPALGRVLAGLFVVRAGETRSSRPSLVTLAQLDRIRPEDEGGEDWENDGLATHG
mmetsp:Transcript_62060/g.183382  ORF Transcript_62060/g.183382 Transcript_62060/m.183382 type:complete len:215 (-) Transcript_62060:700-1344(-)